MKKLFTLLAMIVGINLVAQPAGWLYKDAINVQENSNTLITNYQIKLTINTQALISATQMNANGDDIRFGKTCTGSTLFNYWIESGINTTTTTIWVKIDTLQANATKTIYMFYGNSSATAVSAVMGTFVGPHSSTDSVATGGSGGSANSQRGFRFSPNQNLLVTDFGKREPTGTTRFVTLFDNTTQAVITQTQVSGPAAQYSYGSIGNPIWLISGTQYVLQMYSGTGDGYYFGTSSQIGQHLTYYDMRYCNGCTQNTFPTNVLNNYHYGYPDLWYYTKNETTPAPTYTLNPGTTLNIVSSATAVCNGGSAVLTASGAATYSWNTTATTASISVTPSTTTTYTVYDSGICPSFATITLSVNPNPVVTASGSASLICTGQTATLTAGGATTYSWNTSATTSAIAVSPTVSTTYTVVGTDANNCTAQTTITQSVSACTNLAKNSNEENFYKILPNPNAGEFIFEAANLNEKSTLEIYSSVGQLVHKTEVSNGNNYLNLKHLANGLYYINVKDRYDRTNKISFIKN
ncbi:MAG: DUF2341 domain-containing protein [Bacteroidota bacterium]|nr:DUF2341 domain-containing protein [Bacteroidota bacterium]